MTTTRPKRERLPWRWRLLFATPPAFILIVAIWWDMPRGDVRFVGTWTLQGPVFGRNPGRVLGEFQLNLNGRGSITSNGNTVGFAWEVRDNELHYGYDPHHPVGKLVRTFAGPYRWVTGHVPLCRQNSLRIDRVETDLISVKSTRIQSPDRFTLTRLQPGRLP
jgi:hypothetical protein